MQLFNSKSVKEYLAALSNLTFLSYSFWTTHSQNCCRPPWLEYKVGQSHTLKKCEKIVIWKFPQFLHIFAHLLIFERAIVLSHFLSHIWKVQKKCDRTNALTKERPKSVIAKSHFLKEQQTSAIRQSNFSKELQKSVIAHLHFWKEWQKVR